MEFNSIFDLKSRVLRDVPVRFRSWATDKYRLLGNQCLYFFVGISVCLTPWAFTDLLKILPFFHTNALHRQKSQNILAKNHSQNFLLSFGFLDSVLDFQYENNSQNPLSCIYTLWLEIFVICSIITTLIISKHFLKGAML